MMAFRRWFFLLVILLHVASLSIGQTLLPVDSNFKGAVERQTRTLHGVPGPNYWQNKAVYNLKVDFNPKTRDLKGVGEIVYKNNSSDTLREIWFKLYPNLYKKGVARKSKIANKDLGEGLIIDRIVINGKETHIQDYQIDGTNMHIPIADLLPNDHLQCVIDYHYVLNEGSHLRTGKVDKGSHFIAYFFPRIAVYDDIDGWNKYPYTGEEEFYNDFCDFNVSIAVPNNYVVWATGDLTNGKKVFHKSVNRLLEEASKSDTIVDVISNKSLHSYQITRNKAVNIFKFKADHVVDFAFATSNHYIWKAASLVVDSLSGRRTRVDAVFNSNHRDYQEVIDFALKTVEGMSYVFPAWPFPYNHMTVFDGLDQMEYPMMANDNPTKNREDAITLTSHEIFHTMFPFYMGTNETKYGWMDEGWATIGEWKLSKYIDSAYTDEYGIEPTARSSGVQDDSPIMTLTPDLRGIGTFTNSYPKPALGYLFVEEYLGESLFKSALHHYIRTWQGKHPQPLDFFHAINEASGKDLNWFWQRWFFEDGVLDLCIKDVKKLSEGGYRIKIENKSLKPLPVHLTVYYTDESTEKVNQSIEVWKPGNQTAEITIQTDKLIKKLVLGDTYIPDKNKKDNTFLIN